MNKNPRKEICQNQNHEVYAHRYAFALIKIFQASKCITRDKYTAKFASGHIRS